MSEYIFKANFKIDNCLTCPVSNIVINCPCFTGETHASDFFDSKHPNCPLKELPPHGRLIDADKLKKKMGDFFSTGSEVGYMWLVDDAPTILEASKQD